MLRIFFVLVLIISFMPLNAYAQFRCKGKLVENSRLSKLDVIRYCGEPLMKDSYETQEIVVNDNKRRVTKINVSKIDQWYYTFGTNKTTYVVEFEKGFVVQVIRGEDQP